MKKLLLWIPLIGCVVEDKTEGTVESASLTSILASAPAVGDVIAGRYIVALSARTSTHDVHALVTQLESLSGVDIDHEYAVLPGFAGKLTDAALALLRLDPRVQLVEPDRVVAATTIAPTTTQVDRIDQRVGHDGLYDDHGSDGAGTHVYVIDTGLRATHSEFAGRVGNGYTSILDGRGTNDCHGHGTHVASTAVGTQLGVAKKAIVHPVRVLSCTGSGSTSTVVAGVDFVATDCKNHGPCVANMSLGGPGSDAIDTAVKAAIGKNITFIVAAGNDNTNACNVSPARVPAAITVAAVDYNDARASFSNSGACVDLFAPGVSIKGASIAGDTQVAYLSGTSMAAPHVAGAVAQYLKIAPAATPAAVDVKLDSIATTGAVKNIGSTTPNLLLYNDFGGASAHAPESCEARCGTFDSSQSCQCDPQCEQFGDCCADVEQVCPQDEPADSCVDRCGSYDSTKACQCDASCTQYGDCCTDKAALCG